MSLNSICVSLRAFGYTDELNVDVIENAVKSDVISFSRLIGWLAGELHVLLNTEDVVEEIEDLKDVDNFYSYLSAFLSELGCPISALTVTSIHQRFQSEEVKLSVLQYLLSQVKPARLIALRKLRRQVIEERTKPNEPLKEMAKTLVSMNVQPNQVSDENACLNILKSELTKSFNSLVRRPNPIFNGKFNDKQWSQLNNFAQMLTKDYKIRLEMLLKRLDVTVESFLWSDKAHQHERQVMKIFLPGRQSLAGWKPIGIDQLLGANEDLLVIEKASSVRQRAGTKSKISEFKLEKIPADRGGRTDNIIPPAQETSKSQYQNKDRRGPPKGGKFHKQHEQGLENQVKKEYQTNERGKSYGKKTFYKSNN
ncbi:unnamed protein product [Bursaphelenchus xylophilus]|uniref:(pine wood nematode) hypothetical protein n=1 Tax=Bursaphelenchus xylophilus TaxID=6326 RepID=A0A1I7S4A3_BURXY|nr:unnamed protein product [Bursaphelenchus xylophilus]CAG9116884.1 unnamed protein product [Bursaphelenchus xylophilus]